MATLKVCVEIYMNKKNTKFIQITNISLLFRSFVKVQVNFVFFIHIYIYIYIYIYIRFQQIVLVILLKCTKAVVSVHYF